MSVESVEAVDRDNNTVNTVNTVQWNSLQLPESDFMDLSQLKITLPKPDALSESLPNYDKSIHGGTLFMKYFKEHERKKEGQGELT